MHVIKQSFLLISLLISVNIYSVYIVIHGTFAEDAHWAQPGGDFFDALEKEANQRGHHLINFGWSGDNQHQDRVQGGRSLAKLILSYPPEEEKIIIGHSHAGNVIAVASQFLSQDPEKWLEVYQEIVRRDYQDQTIFLYEEYAKAMKDILRIKQKSLKNLKESEGNYYIARVYFLATPIDEKRYMPDMTAIKELYNLYSKGDLVQPVFWTYNRLLSSHPQIVNLRVTIEDSGWLGMDNPTHSGMHDPKIAEWILAIPHELCLQKMCGFENFDFQHNGKLYFSKYGQLMYKIDAKSQEEREAKELATMEGAVRKV